MSHRIQFRLARKLRAGFASGHASSGDSQPTPGGLNSPKIETMEPAKGGLDLEKELTCSICTEVLYQPLTLLDCLHTFCGSCLKEWFTSQLNTTRKSPNSLPAGTAPYTCPSCRAPVRDTKHNATVTTLLEMYLAASPEKGKTNQEKAELEKTYKPGDSILPKLDSREMTLRERMVEDEDRALINEVRDLSLREAGVESSEARRQRRRREEGRSHEHRARTSLDNSRESRERRTTEDRERRRRREAEAERRQERVPTEERRRRRSDGESRRRHEEAHETTARQVEHQSSLRSLISSSDIDSREMEEEILRQIREEGLLDGIDLENIDVNQEDDISERIAEAFRRRQNERARHAQPRRSDASGTHSRTHSRSRTSGSVPNTPSRDTSIGAGRRRTHSRSPSSVSQSEEQSRPPPSISAIQASHLEVQSSDESRRRRRRTTSSSRNSTPAAVTETRTGSRSQTDLNDRPRSINTPISGPSSPSNTRSSTDPIVRRSADLSSSSRPVQEPQPAQPMNSTPTADTSPRPQETSEISSKNVPKSRAPPPGELPLSNTSTSFSEPLDRSLLPLPLSPRALTQPTLADRANALSSGSRPTSSSSSVVRPRPEYFAEPSIMCAKCGRNHIEYELHYNCGICSSGHYNICLGCYRAGKGCLYWFGFGYTAFAKWESKIQSGDLPANAERPHMLHASRYVPPRTVPGGAEGRRTLTTDDPQKRLQSGVFCANCLAWTNECYWRCDVCNDGDWGFCNLCVNQGRSCTHPLLPLTYKPSNQNTPPLSPSQDQKAPPSASILTGPNVVTFGSFKPLTFLTTCDVCHSPIQPSSSRFHCFCCTSRVPNTQPGDYDICTSCYPKLVASRRISVENGPNGWRRCLRGHRMIIAGFEDTRSGQRRTVVRDIVGGRGLIEEPAPADQGNSDLMLWSWGKGVHISGDRSHKKLVTKDVMKSVPVGSSSTAHEQGFPPDGGVGMKAVAIWGWYPTEGADDELLFPKGAEVRECKDVNTDWFYGTYMGKSGLFQANYVRVLDTTVS